MSDFLAVIYTPGRTGSHLIMGNLCNYYDVNSRTDQEVNFANDIVHTHNPIYQPPTDNFIAIISRRNLFDSILSTQIARQTNECVDYTNKDIVPFAVDIEDFRQCYFFQTAFYQAIDQTKFVKAIDVYYEDMLANPAYLFNQLGIRHSIDLELSNRSPYRYQAIITNIDELKTVYTNLGQITITDAELDSFKQTVASDIANIRSNTL